MTPNEFTLMWVSSATGQMRSTTVQGKAAAIKEARQLDREGATNITVSQYDPATSWSQLVEWEK